MLTGILLAMIHAPSGRFRFLGTPRTGPGLASGLLSGLLATFLSAMPAAAQNVVVDQGTFLLSRNGEPIGTETFTIRRSGRGANVKFIATGDVTREVNGSERRLTSALEATGSEMSVSAYQVKEAGERPTEVYMTHTGRRFQATLRTPEGEELREYRASPSAVVLEEEVAHHYHFLASRVSGETTSVPALVPRTAEQLRLQITDAGTERTSIAGRMIQARHLVIQAGGETRDLWVDTQGRVLRIVDRATGFRAERRNAPD